jgi:hypothetical protein
MSQPYFLKHALALCRGATATSIAGLVNAYSFDLCTEGTRSFLFF